MLEARGFVILGIFSGEYLALYSRWRILVARLDVSGIMDLVADMSMNTKIKMSPNTFGMPFTFFF